MISRLFREQPPIANGPEVQIRPGRHALDLPANSDTRLLAGEPLLVTRTEDGLVARDPDTGDERWQYPVRGWFSWAASEDGQLLAVRQNNRIEVVRADEGQGIKSLELPPEAELSRDPVGRASTVKFGPEHTLIADFKATGREGSRTWAEYNLAFYDLETGQGPAVARMGSVGHMAFSPLIAPDGETLLCDDSYGLKALDLPADEQLWQRNDIRSISAIKSGPEGKLAVLHNGGIDILEQASGQSLAQKKGWWTGELHTLPDRIIALRGLRQSLTSVSWKAEEQWKLDLPEGTTFRQVLVTNDLIYATATSEKEGYQTRLLLADPRTGDVLAQSQPLGHLQHGLPMFQTHDKVYLALQDGALSFSPADLKVDELRREAEQAPVSIEVGSNFVQVGGVRLKSRASG